MQQGDNQYQQYGYDQYQPPQKRGLTEKIFGPAIAQKLRSPLVATFVLLLVGAAFAGVIIGSYPGKEAEEAPVPIIRADAEPAKTVPAEPGGMSVPFRESTVFNTVRSNPMDPDTPVENLLDPDEKAIDKLAAFEAEAAEALDITEKPEGEEGAEEMTVEDGAAVMARAEKKTTTIKQEVKKIPPQEIASAAPEKAVAQKPPSRTLPPAGTSPETLAFVKSVLDKKDGTAAARAEETAKVAQARQKESLEAARQAASIEPAAGAATGAIASPGDYFVQLASVTSAEATGPEWEKLKKKFPELADLEHTVQEANLGERGTYYRIRVGPYNKELASSLCARIKAQKPGGCLVTK